MSYGNQFISSDNSIVVPPLGEEDKYVLTKVNQKLNNARITINTYMPFIIHFKQLILTKKST